MLYQTDVTFRGCRIHLEAEKKAGVLRRDTQALKKWLDSCVKSNQLIMNFANRFDDFKPLEVKDDRKA